MQVTGVYETVLYAADVPGTARFYADVLGLREIGGPDATAAGFRLSDGRVLLIFDPEHSSQPGRGVPSHGATGPGHVAFAVAAGTLAEWAAHLRERGVPLERELGWPAGGHSLYVRDPAGNSVELVDGEVWQDGRGAG